MNTNAKTPAAPASAAPCVPLAPQSLHRECSPRSLLEVLYAKAADHLDEADLVHLDDAADVASELVRQAGAVAQGIALLVESDQHAENKAGSFTSGQEVGALLYLLAGTLSHVEGLLYVSGEAAYRLRPPSSCRKAQP